MKINVPLAGWILSVVAFLLGTIVPAIYKRFSYDGISVQQLSNIRSVSAFPGQKTVYFSTLLKVANVDKQAIVIEGLDAAKIAVPGFSLELLRTEFKFFARGEIIALPASHPIVLLQPDGNTTTDIPESVRPVFEDFPPLIVKSDEDKLLGITMYFDCPEVEKGKEGGVVDALYNYILHNGLPIRLHINGRYRSFTLRILPISTTVS